MKAYTFVKDYTLTEDYWKMVAGGRCCVRTTLAISRAKVKLMLG